MSDTGYVHGFDAEERQRLRTQATTLADLLLSDTKYGEGSRVLEAGCGTGAQTLTLALGNPGARFTAIDLAPGSLEHARRDAEAAGLTNVEFRQADILALPFVPESFDHVFVCFVLEHVRHPIDALVSLQRVLKPGGTITVIEGDHGSAYFHPDSEDARASIAAFVRLQRAAGGNPMIGRELQPLLRSAGFAEVRVSPRMVYVDSTRPDLAEGFTRQTFTAMLEGVREDMLAKHEISAEAFDRGIDALRSAGGRDGVFCYTFFKAVGTRSTL